jgi:3'(2'), 5'-bisphosphate nucleotidase
MEWDTAAAHAIVKEAGGVVNDVNGSELSYNKPDLHNPDFFVYAKSNQQLRKLIKELL